MTLARVKATGRGGVRFVFCIEGVPVQFCTDAHDAIYATNGPLAYVAYQRYPGLRSQDWSFSEKIDIVQAKLEAEGISIQIADVDAKYDDGTGKIFRYKTATSVFGSSPQHTTYLSADITDASTVVPVLATTGFDSFDTTGTVHVGTEAIRFDALDATDFGTLGTPASRAAFRSYATYHYVYDGNGGSAGESAFSPVTDRPVHFEGRRVEIFAYDAGETIDIDEDPSTGDAPFWIGIISAEPTFDGATWSLNIDPITSRFKQKLGSALGEAVGIRGIYYPAAAPFSMRIVEWNAAALIGSSAVTAEVAFAMAGFWETQADFCAALTTQIAAQLAAPASGGPFTQTNVTARVADDGTWGITFSTAATPHFMQFYGLAPNQCFSLVDGTSDTHAVRLSGAPVSTLAASKSYDVIMIGTPGLDGAGTVPRTTYSGNMGVAGATYGAAVRAVLGSVAARLVNCDEATYPRTRIYLGGSVEVSTIATFVTIQWTANGVGRDVAMTSTARIEEASVSGRWIRLNEAAVQPTLCATSANDPQLQFSLDLGTGTLADLILRIEALAPQYGPLGAIPMMRLGEITTSTLAEAAADSPLTTNRGWIIHSKHDLEEVVSQECRLLGCFPCIGSGGQIDFARLRFGLDGETPDASFTEADFIVDRGKFYKTERAPFGLINLWTLKTGYNPDSDEWEGTTLRVIDQESRSNAGKVRELQITPYSKNLNPLTETLLDAQRLASKMLGVLGGPYQTLTFRSPLSKMTVTCGSVIRVTHPRLPDGSGGFGVVNKAMYVIGRTVKPRGAYVEFTCLMTFARVGGYAPSSRVLNADISGTTGTTGPFTAALQSDYLQSGATVSDYWAVGDLIRVFVWNSSTPATILGTITVVTDPLTIVFTTTTNWTRGTSDWVFGSRVSSAVSSDTQQRYAYEASAGGRVDFADDDTDAYVFA